MIKLLKHRFLSMVPTLLGVTFISFALLRLAPGDPVLLILGERGGAPEVYAEMRANLGLDKTLPEQFMIYLGNVFSGDLGQSIVSKRPVLEEFLDRFPATIELGVLAVLFGILIGVPCGMIAAVKRNQALDYTLMGGALVGYSMPIFWWGLILIMFFSVHLGWTPVSGRISVMYDIDSVTGFLLIDSLLSEESWAAFKSTIHHLLLPVIVLGTIPLAAIARMTRSSLLEVLNEDYIRTAKAKGLGVVLVVIKHALRNALIPIITVIGLLLGTILTGAILTETIFSWPGLGRWFVSSIEARDYPVVQGGIVLIALTIMIVNLVVDLLYFWANPTLRSSI